MVRCGAITQSPMRILRPPARAAVVRLWTSSLNSSMRSMFTSLEKLLIFACWSQWFLFESNGEAEFYFHLQLAVPKGLGQVCSSRLPQETIKDQGPNCEAAVRELAIMHARILASCRK